MISSYCSSTSKLGVCVTLVFSVGQHSRDQGLIERIVDYLGCGDYIPRSEHNYGDFRVRSNKDIMDKIIPFYDKYPLQGSKALDYADFKRVVYMMKAKAHLTPEGLEEILRTKGGMNSRRSP